MATALSLKGEEEDFYEMSIRPNLQQLTSMLRVEIIQQSLQQEYLITDYDDQVLRLKYKTPIDRSVYLLDLMKGWDADAYFKFCQIVRKSASTCPSHRTVAKLLKLPETSDSVHPDRSLHDTKEGKRMSYSSEIILFYYKNLYCCMP
jgi:hypothetical protein